MRDRWDRLSDTNRGNFTRLDLDPAEALLCAADDLHNWTGDRRRKLRRTADVWIYWDALLDELGVSCDELFAAVCSQVNPQLSAEVNTDTDSTDKAVEHIGDDATSEAHDRVQAFVDAWKASVFAGLTFAALTFGSMVDDKGKAYLLLLEDLETLLADLKSQQPVEEINEATAAVLTAIERNSILATGVFNTMEYGSSLPSVAHAIYCHIADVVDDMSNLPQAMTGPDSADPAIPLLDVDLSVVDWVKVAETVLGWSEQ